jgi:hypothetical protein
MMFRADQDFFGGPLLFADFFESFGFGRAGLQNDRARVYGSYSRLTVAEDARE